MAMALVLKTLQELQPVQLELCRAMLAGLWRCSWSSRTSSLEPFLRDLGDGNHLLLCPSLTLRFGDLIAAVMTESFSAELKEWQVSRACVAAL
jgi:hypothetical protein